MMIYTAAYVTKNQVSALSSTAKGSATGWAELDSSPVILRRSPPNHSTLGFAFPFLGLSTNFSDFASANAAGSM